jgi:hypothetical protein
MKKKLDIGYYSRFVNNLVKDVQDDYFGVKAVSNSAFSAINPQEGGNPRKYQNFLNKDSDNRPKSLSLERGTLIHKYLEKPDAFYIADVVKPTEMMESWVAAVYKTCQDENHPDFQGIVVKEKESLGVYATTKDAKKIYDKFLAEGMGYFKYLSCSNGKLLMDNRTKEIITTLIQRIDAIPEASAIVRAGLSEFETHLEVINEDDIFFNLQITVDGKSKVLFCKSRLDKTIIDHKEKTIQLTDYKSSSSSAYRFAQKEVANGITENGEPVQIYLEKGSFYSYRYYRQIAWYVLALLIKYSDLINQGYVVLLPTILVLETNTEEFNVVPYTISQESVVKGIYEFEDLLQTIALHEIENNWDYPLTFMFNNEI